MRDVDIAKELLEKEQLALAIVKNCEIIFISRDIGIKPLYTAVEEIKDELKGSSVADRVTGKAAAMLCKYAGIKELHTNLISENAIKVMDTTTILYYYDESSPYIKNRDETGMCPVETLSLNVNNIYDLLQGISNFLESLKKVC